MELTFLAKISTNLCSRKICQWMSDTAMLAAERDRQHPPDQQRLTEQEHARTNNNKQKPDRNSQEGGQPYVHRKCDLRVSEVSAVLHSEDMLHILIYCIDLYRLREIVWFMFCSSAAILDDSWHFVWASCRWHSKYSARCWGPWGQCQHDARKCIAWHSSCCVCVLSLSLHILCTLIAHSTACLPAFNKTNKNMHMNPVIHLSTANNPLSHWERHAPPDFLLTLNFIELPSTHGCRRGTSTWKWPTMLNGCSGLVAVKVFSAFHHKDPQSSWCFE